ncbi:hypothetical protein [Natronospora cellulosivora (SeqCode)]
MKKLMFVMMLFAAMLLVFVGCDNVAPDDNGNGNGNGEEVPEYEVIVDFADEENPMFFNGDWSSGINEDGFDLNIVAGEDYDGGFALKIDYQFDDVSENTQLVFEYKFDPVEVSTGDIVQFNFYLEEEIDTHLQPYWHTDVHEDNYDWIHEVPVGDVVSNIEVEEDDEMIQIGFRIHNHTEGATEGSIIFDSVYFIPAE